MVLENLNEAIGIYTDKPENLERFNNLIEKSGCIEYIKTKIELEFKKEFNQVFVYAVSEKTTLTDLLHIQRSVVTATNELIQNHYK